MHLVAGIDIGNSTTEIVVSLGNKPVAWDRRPTRGQKGSESSVQAAAGLLRSIERNHNLQVDHVVVAPWSPVTTATSTVHEPQPDTGRLRIISSSSNSVSGDGSATGAPWSVLSPLPTAGDLIAVVPIATGFEIAAQFINQAVAKGCKIGAVVAADDEAVLISRRLDTAIPVIDGVDFDVAVAASYLFVEVRPSGKLLKTATDVWAMKSLFSLSDVEAEPLNLLTRWVKDERSILIGLFPLAQQPVPEIESSVTWRSGVTENLFHAVPKFPESLVGDVTSIFIDENQITSDVWGFDITSALATTGLRNSGHTRDLAIAQLSKATNSSDYPLAEIFGTSITVATSEAAAAALGANSTPGLIPDSLILDIGGGTIDLIGEVEISAAGAGELLTASVSQALSISRGAADWVKRGSAQRLDTPHVLLGEDGTKDFVPETKEFPATATGSLVTQGPAGYLTFGKNLQPAEWRIMRHSLKRAALGNNVARIIRSLSIQTGHSEPRDIVIVGGPAADDELIPILGELNEVRGLGRGNVAGLLGHRYAVAYGLSQMAK